MKNLKQVEIEIAEIAKIIAAPNYYLPTYGFSEGTARPHVEVIDNEYHYVISERGSEYKRIKTHNFKELLYTTFKDITFGMAVELELSNRNKNEDSRIQLFQIQENLLGRIDWDFKQRVKLIHHDLLKKDGITIIGERNSKK